jgi:hypothetical protein
MDVPTIFISVSGRSEGLHPQSGEEQRLTRARGGEPAVPAAVGGRLGRRRSAVARDAQLLWAKTPGSPLEVASIVQGAYIAAL